MGDKEEKKQLCKNEFYVHNYGRAICEKDKGHSGRHESEEYWSHEYFYIQW